MRNVSRFYTKMSSTEDSAKVALVLMIICCVICATAIGPLAIIWALNTLFNTHIEYSFENWVAVIILYSVISGVKYTRSTKSND